MTTYNPHTSSSSCVCGDVFVIHAILHARGLFSTLMYKYTSCASLHVLTPLYSLYMSPLPTRFDLIMIG